MSDYPMLISNKLHSFRNFILQSSMKIWIWTIPIFRYFRISPMEFPLCLMILWRWHRMHRKELIEPDF